ncbi:MAG: SET domain-containing protein-lysine N-methyltransferase [Chitinophagaceae bacterium]|nr:SET domain-containing protein-lysine N-methyltransferase [Chitinophagaceae bacterium]
MALLEKQLYVKKSTIPNAGKGLFTKKAISKGERIIEYRGKITAWKVVKNDDHNPYIFYITRNHVINAQNHLKVLARYANDARGLTRITGITNNAEFVVDKKLKRAFIEAKKNIPAGAEILVGYGKEYWDIIRYNIKIGKE